MRRIWITDGSGSSAAVINYGAALQSLLIRSPHGVRDVCLGYDSVGQYKFLDGCMGGTVGRCANRIGGCAVTVGGKRYSLSRTHENYQLHGGFQGFHKKLWSYEAQPNCVTLRYISPDGEEGYPGTLCASVRYSWVSPGVLSIEYDCVGDRDTVINLTNHSYFNLTGERTVLGHELWLNSRRVAHTDGDNTPDGGIDPVDGTALDFSLRRSIGSRIGDELASLRRCAGYDHFYLLDGQGMRPAAKLWGGGLSMEVSTDLPCLGLYTANFLSPRRGKDGAEYAPYLGVCLETQYLPNAVNLPDIMPKPLFAAGEHYRHTTLLRFACE